MIWLPRRRLRSALFGALAVTSVGCSYLKAHQREALDRWLLCDDCVEGELDSVVAIKGKAVPRLSNTLYGPSDEKMRNVRDQVAASYTRLQNRLGGPAGVGESAEDYVRRYLGNYLVVHQARSAVALGRIGTPGAILVLRRAARHPEFSEDVQEAISESLSEAEVEILGVVRGDSQSASVGSVVDTNPTVRIERVSLPPYQLLALIGLIDDETALGGDSVARVPVSFVPDPGSGSVSSDVILAEFGDTASVAWTLGLRPGRQQLRVTAGRHSYVFTAYAQPVDSVLLGIFDGNLQQAPVGAGVRIPPSVIVTDGRGSPVSGDTVVFTVTAGGGTVTDSIQFTDRQGIAIVGSWRMGLTVADSNRLAAASAAASYAVTFHATATAARPDTMIIVGGDNQSALVDRPLPEDAAVMVLDGLGNSVPGVSVIFTVIAGDGNVSSDVVETNVDGVAAVSWVMGPNPGDNQLAARSVDLPTVIFSATATSPE